MLSFLTSKSLELTPISSPFCSAVLLPFWHLVNMRIAGLNLLEKGLGYRHLRPKGKECIPGAEMSIILANSSEDVGMQHHASCSLSILLNPIGSNSSSGPVDNLLCDGLDGALARIVPLMEDNVSKIEGLIGKICLALGSLASQEEIDYAELKTLQTHWVAIAKVCIILGAPREFTVDTKTARGPHYSRITKTCSEYRSHD